MRNPSRSENIDRELNEYLNEPGFIANLNLSKFSTPEIEAWVRSKIGKRYPTDYAPSEMQTIRLLRGRWQQWLKRGRKPREDVSADPSVAPLIRDLLKELGEEMDQPPPDKAWLVKGFTDEDLKEAQDDLEKLNEGQLDILVAAIAHASRDYSSAVKALLTFVPDEEGRS